VVEKTRANCESTRLGPGGEAAAKVLSEGKEWYDVKTGKNTREESAADMRANEAGRRADPRKSCDDAAQNYRDKVISEKKIDLFGTRKKGR
jgi:hypothetical protein